MAYRALPWIVASLLGCTHVAGVSAAADVATRTITVVAAGDYPPYLFPDGKGGHQGITHDLWVLWAQRTGIRVDLQALEWSKAREIMESGQADVIDTIFRTTEREALYDFITPAYSDVSVPVYFHKSVTGINDENSLRGFTVGVVNGDACAEHLQRKGIDTLRVYPGYEDIVLGAQRGEVRVFCIDTPVATYHLVRLGIESDFRHSAPLYTVKLGRAVARSNDAMHGIVAAGFRAISAAEYDEVERRWLGAALLSPKREEMFRNASYALLTLVALTALLLIWNHTLRRRVALRTTELSTALEAVRSSETRFRSLFKHANDAIFIMDGARCVDCNPQAEQMYGAPRERIVGTSPLDFSPEYQPDGLTSAETVDQHVARALGGDAQHFEWCSLLPDARVIYVDVSLSRFEDAGHFFLQAVVRDVSERKSAEAEIERLAYYDPLTLLPNRRMLMDRLSLAIASSQRHHNHGALLFIDLDHFKMLNDTRGHSAGDQLLCAISARLLDCVRSEDLVVRLGGDEFVVMIEDLSADAAEAAAQTDLVAHKILAEVRKPLQLDGLNYETTTSIGVCLFSGDGAAVDDLLKRADAAMYRAKNAGRDAIRYFDPALQTALEARASLERDLRRALPERQLALHLQVQVDADGTPRGAEALLRWTHPQRGNIPPAQFILLAEETGLIVAIGDWVLETACAVLRGWQGKPRLEALRLAVNVSTRQFKQPGFVPHVRAIVLKSGINPARLKLELTENLVLDHLAESVEKMHALRALGIGFSLDDFGTGYSSLAYLKKLPLDEIKIDRSFVRDITTDPGDAVLVQTIIGMARNLGLDIVAEGVETDAQRTFLRRNRCSGFQGELFGHPMPLAEFETHLDQPPERR